MPHSVTRYHDISCGHRVVGHEGKCRFLHGHNYRIHFTCEALPTPEAVRMVRERTGMSIMDAREVTNPLDEVGRVIDFSVVKAKLCQWLEDNWDHKMLLWDRDAIFPTLEASDVQPGLVAVSFNPTAENMARYLVETVGPKQLHGTNVQLVMVEVEETRKCSATYWRKR